MFHLFLTNYNMKMRFSDKVIDYIKNTKRTDVPLSKKIKKQLLLFSSNPKHPSLRLHKLTGELNDMWSISIDKSIRMIYSLIKEGDVYFVDIGTHEEVYKK